jgi:ribonuclease E
VGPTKLASRARKVITPEITEQAPTQLNPVAPQPGPARRSRAATKSTESTESEPAKPTKPARKTTTRGTKAGAASEADAETEVEPAKGGLRRGTRTRSQSAEAPAPAPARTKRRVGAKKAADATLDPPAEDGGPDPSLGGTDRTEHPEVPPAGAKAKAGTGAVRGRRGKTKVAAAETEDESAVTDVGTGALRVARGGKRTPTANVGTTTGAAAGAASNRATAATATGKGRVVGRVGAGASSGKSAARAVGEKENTPERIHVKEEEDEKLQLPSGAVVAKGGRARKGATAAAAASKALSEPEKDVTAPKTRAPRKRAASGKK